MHRQTTFQKAFALLLIILSLTACRDGQKPINFKVNPAFLPYISGFSGGVISSKSEIKVKLAFQPEGAVELNVPVANEYFDFKPSIKGITYWSDASTIVFKPEKLLKPNLLYEAKLNMGKIMPMPENLKVFEFSFKTTVQAAEVLTNGLVCNEANDAYTLTGTVLTADYVGADTLKNAFKAYLNGTELSDITFTHKDLNTQHSFVINGIKRNTKQGELNIKLDDKILGIKEPITEVMAVQPKDIFTVIKTKLVNEDENHVVIWFSDPLLSSQDLDGLISTSGNYDETPGWSIENNILRVYPARSSSNTVTLHLSEGIKNREGKTLPSARDLNISINDTKPVITFVGNGVITPTDQGSMVYFGVGNLNAVDVKVMKIFENNIPQFLQNDDLGGGYNLVRVGKVVKKTTVHLPVEELNTRRTMSTHALKLDELIKTEPGAIYRIILSYKPEYSTYPCPDRELASNKLTKITKDDDDNDNGYNNYRSYDNDYDNEGYYEEDYYEYDYDYDWSQRNNPCSPSFFNSSNAVSRNILASNIALTTKLGNDQRMHVIASNIVTAKAMSGLKIKVLDYQNQVLASGTTDNKGVFELKIPEKAKPFLVIAEGNKQNAYLKVDNYRALSTSSFDVSGVDLKDGIKGFVYGERGVWRPGDTLFLGFVLNDKDNPLPESYPVILEIMNPKWQVIHKDVKPKKAGQSLFAFKVPTDQDALTGYYNAKVTIGNQEFTKSLKVETVMPNRLKIDVKYKGEYLSPQLGSNELSLYVKWLHGAPAPGLKTIVNAAMQPSSIYFENHKGFNFNNPLSRYNAEEINIFDGNLDREGKATIPVSVGGSKYMPPKFNMALNIRVFEQGGAFSVDRFSVPYYVYKTYVGIKTPGAEGYNQALDITKSNKLSFVSVNEKGKAIANQALQLRIYKFNYNWWWQINDNNIGNIFDSEATELITEQKLTTNASGEASFDFQTDKKAYGKYFIYVMHSDGHSSGKIIYLDDNLNHNRIEDQAQRNVNQLNIGNIKEKYSVGEQVEVNIPASEGSQVLICMENYRGVQHFEWLNAGKDGVTYKFKATADMAPNVYLNTTILQPYRNNGNDLPIRRYGVNAIMVEDPTSHLVPVIKAPTQTRPDTKIKVEIAEQDKKAMEYTIAIVDEGLLDLTRFKTPDAWPEMYAKTSHGVRTWDLYDMIVGTFTGKIESMASIGGDDEGGAPKGNAKANRFKPMVRFLGPFKLDKGKKAEHMVHIPEYIGSARIMVVASNNAGAYGSAQQDLEISQPLMVLATMPRVISPNEEFAVPVSVFFDGKTVKQAKVNIAHNNFFNTVSSKDVLVKYVGETEEMAYFTLKASNETGIGKVKVTAISGTEKSTHEIEIDVRAPNPAVILQDEFSIEQGKSIENEQLNNFISGTGSYWIELSSIPPINLKSRLRYLLQYPHGCIEQTTSGAFPQLYLAELMDLSEYERKQTDKNIKAAINRIYKFQTGGGGFAYWPGGNTDEPYATSYAGHFLVEAMNKGYAVNKGFMDKWKKYQKEAAKRFANNRNYKNESYYNEDIIQAYRLYTLALAGSPDYASMNKLRESKNLSTMAAWRLAASYQLAGQREAALRLMGNLPSSNLPSYNYDYSYGSRERDEAVILEALTIMDQKALANNLIKSVSLSLKDNRWMSTQTTAYCLMAVSKYLGGEKASKNIAAEIEVNGKLHQVNSGMPFVQHNIEKPGKKLNIKIRNKSKGLVFVRIVSTGIPPAEESKAKETNLNMQVRFYDNSGKDIDFTNLAQATDFIAEVTVRNPGFKGNYQNLALNAMFASGFEIANSRMDEMVEDNSYFDYQDIRDDRVLTYFSLAANKSKTFRFRLNATYAGKFYLPVIQCEAMYDNTVSANSSGKWIEVKRVYNVGGI